MNKPPVSILRTLLKYGARPMTEIHGGEHNTEGSAWVIYSCIESAPCMVLTIEGYRKDQTNDMSPVREEIEHYLHVHKQLEIVQDANLRSKIIYYVSAQIRKEESKIHEREFRVHHPEDPIWAQLAVAGLNVPWYTPGMKIEGAKLIYEEKIL